MIEDRAKLLGLSGGQTGKPPITVAHQALPPELPSPACQSFALVLRILVPRRHQGTAGIKVVFGDKAPPKLNGIGKPITVAMAERLSSVG